MVRKKQSRVSKKISILRHEGIPERQSVAMALQMNRDKRLTKSGGYRRVKKGGRRRKRGYNRSHGGR
jgi:hypothetical protein